MSKIIDKSFSDFFASLSPGDKVYITIRKDIPSNISPDIWWGCFLDQTLCCTIENINNPNNPIINLSDEDFKVLKKYKHRGYSYHLGITPISITRYSISPLSTLEILIKTIINELI
jgi:hypothetical protein